MTESTESTQISAEEVAEQVTAIHERLDDFKEWSQDIAEWLDAELQRFVADGDHEAAEHTLQLIRYVDTVFLRIEKGDEAMAPTEGEVEVEGVEGDDDADL